MEEYCIVSIRGLDAQRRFVRKVCDLIQQGWTPQGGVFCIMNGGCVLGYVQAMVKMKTAMQLIFREEDIIPALSEEVEPWQFPHA